MSKIKFNKSNIDNLKPTEIRYKVYTDECRGLYVEISYEFIFLVY